MTSERIETFRGRQLRRELFRLRESANMSTDQVAAELYWSKGKISRIETGKNRVSPSDVRLLLDVYGITDAGTRRALIDLAREARKKGWWEEFSDVFRGSYIALEAEAATLRVYESHVVPGLFQTEDYHRALIATVRPGAAPGEADRLTAARITRHEKLGGEHAPQVSAVIDEAALRRAVGSGQIMRDQLRALAEAAELPGMDVRVLPLSAGPREECGVSFSILGISGPTELSVVYLEHLSGGIYLDDSEAVARYTAAFDRLSADAVAPAGLTGLLAG